MKERFKSVILEIKNSHSIDAEKIIEEYFKFTEKSLLVSYDNLIDKNVKGIAKSSFIIIQKCQSIS